MNMGPLDAIVFDFDGVLADTEPLHFRAMVTVARTVGIELGWAEYLARYVGYEDADALRLMLGLPIGVDADRDDQRIEALRLRKAAAFAAEVDAGVQTFPGVLELAREAAAAGTPLAIASGATRREVDQVFRKLNITIAFDPIVTADRVAVSKPAPDSYRAALAGIARRQDVQSLDPAACVAIEDTATGLTAARAAGLRTLGFATSGSPDALRAADRIVTSMTTMTLADLRALVRK